MVLSLLVSVLARLGLHYYNNYYRIVMKNRNLFLTAQRLEIQGEDGWVWVRAASGSQGADFSPKSQKSETFGSLTRQSNGFGLRSILCLRFFALGMLNK